MVAGKGPLRRYLLKWEFIEHLKQFSDIGSITIISYFIVEETGVWGDDVASPRPHSVKEVEPSLSVSWLTLILPPLFSHCIYYCHLESFTFTSKVDRNLREVFFDVRISRLRENL